MDTFIPLCLKVKKLSIKFDINQSKWDYVKVRMCHHSSDSNKRKDYKTVIIVSNNEDLCIDEQAFAYSFIGTIQDNIELEIIFLKDYLEDSRICNLPLSQLKLGTCQEEIYLDKFPAWIKMSYSLDVLEPEINLKEKTTYISKSAQNFSLGSNISSPCHTPVKLKRVSDFTILVNNLELNKEHSKLESIASTNFNTTSYTVLEESDMLSNGEQRETFCSAFFISGLPFKNAKLIPDSENFSAPCEHKLCSNLPAYRAELLTKFPSQDKNSKTFEMTNAIASLCFPLGIKLCFHQNENDIKTMKNFLTVTTSESGNRNYIYVYHYYQKVDFFEFKQLYDFDPIKDQFLQNKIVELINQSVEQMKHSSSLEKKIQENLKICSELISSDYIYLPTAACLVSSMPYTVQMEKSIESIIKTAIDEKKTSYELSKLVHHLIYEVPIPPTNKILSFYLPYVSIPINLQGKLVNDLPIIPAECPSLFNFFTVDMILQIHQLMLFEQKILFIYSDLSKLTSIMEALISLLYPMTWTGTYIPVLSENLIKYIQSFMPFIMGINESMLKRAMEYFEEDSKIYLIHIKDKASSVMEISSVDHTKLKKSISKKSLSGVLPELPSECKEVMVKNLKLIKKTYEKDRSAFNNSFMSADSSSYESFNYKLDKAFRMVFIKTMIRLFGDFSEFTSYINDQGCFNSESFVSEKPMKYKEFYSELIMTTMFGLFTHDSKEENEHFVKLCKKYSQIIIKNNRRRSFFHKDDSAYLMSKDHDTSLIVRNSIRSSNQLIDLSKLNISRVVKSNKDLPDLSGSKKKRESDKNLLRANSDLLGSDLNRSSESLNSEYIERYLITPYFLEYVIKDPGKIEESINEAFKKEDLSHLTQRFSKKIFTFRNLIRELPQEKMKKYLIPNEHESEKREYFFNTNTEDNEKNSKIELLDHLRNILNSRNNHPLSKKDLTRILMSKESRIYFSNILYQKKFNEHNYHLLHTCGFDNLVRMISTSLLLCQNDTSEFDHIRILTKSCFCYYKNLSTGVRLYVYEDITRTKPFDVWLNRDFWENWFLLDLKEKREDSNMTNMTNMSKLTIEDIYFMILIDLGTIMINLNMEISLVVYVIVEKVGVKYLNNNLGLVKNLELTLLKHLENKLKEKDI